MNIYESYENLGESSLQGVARKQSEQRIDRTPIYEDFDETQLTDVSPHPRLTFPTLPQSRIGRKNDDDEDRHQDNNIRGRAIKKQEKIMATLRTSGLIVAIALAAAALALTFMNQKTAEYKVNKIMERTIIEL